VRDHMWWTTRTAIAEHTHDPTRRANALNTEIGSLEVSR